MSAHVYLDQLIERFHRLRDSQLEPLEDAAEVCSEAIAAGGLVHLFGTGHGTMPALEAFPRTGSFVGWHPIVIDAVGPHLRIGGEGSVHQFRFLQGAEGYGKAILDSYVLPTTDPFIVCSHSGVNRVLIEVAHAVKERGHTLVAITSLDHSSRAATRHPSGQRLFELADIVLDTGAPFGEATVEIEGLEQKVAAVSTSLATALINALVAETAARLVRKGHAPLVLGHIDRHGDRLPDEMRRDYVSAHLGRMWGRTP
jgi:uncharacterized phosphosugar-binding protein